MPCYRQDYKKNFPYKWAYGKQRNNAKSRGVPFLLTFDEFKEFCIRTNILHGRGRTSESFHIDRIQDYDRYGNKMPYAIWNIQKLTNKENIMKENNRRALVKQKVIVYDWQYKTGYCRPISTTRNQEAPF